MRFEDSRIMFECRMLTRSPRFKPVAKTNEMRIDVVEQCASRYQAERHREAAAIRFDEAPLRVLPPERLKVRHLLALSTSPFRRRSHRRRDLRQKRRRLPVRR